MADQSPKGAREDHAPSDSPVPSVPPAPSDDKADRDNRARQLNSNNDAYWQSRGLPGRPAAGSKKGAK